VVVQRVPVPVVLTAVAMAVQPVVAQQQQVSQVVVNVAAQPVLRMATVPHVATTMAKSALLVS
jgi:hypothetical protein